MNDLFSLYSISVYNLFIISVFNGDLCSFKLGAVMNNEYCSYKHLVLSFLVDI